MKGYYDYRGQSYRMAFDPLTQTFHGERVDPAFDAAVPQPAPPATNVVPMPQPAEGKAWVFAQRAAEVLQQTGWRLQAGRLRSAKR